MNNNYIYGIHTVLESLKSSKSIEKVVICIENNAKIQQIEKEANRNNVAIEKIKKDELDALLGTTKHQGVAALRSSNYDFKTLDFESFFTDKKSSLVLVLDEIKDPHNLGACFRIASAFDVDAIICPKDNSASITPAVEKVASGATNHVAFFPVTNLSRAIDFLKENQFFVYGADGYSDDSLYEEKFSGNVALVMGSEGQGMRRLTKEKCDVLFKIPISKKMESLNVSVATGICIAEIRRQLGNF
jgi:23S rRNA (guanosine2251-2'-O)-methyltransferase